MTSAQIASPVRRDAGLCRPVYLSCAVNRLFYSPLADRPSLPFSSMQVTQGQQIGLPGFGRGFFIPDPAGLA